METHFCLFANCSRISTGNTVQVEFGPFGIYSDVGKDTQICLSSEFPYQYIRGIVIQLKMSFYRDFPYYQKTHFQTPCWATTGTVKQHTLYCWFLYIFFRRMGALQLILGALQLFKVHPHFQKLKCTPT